VRYGEQSKGIVARSRDEGSPIALDDEWYRRVGLHVEPAVRRPSAYMPQPRR
jgi:hypothetical protein